MDTPDLRPATDRMAGLLAAIRDDQLDLPTPCPDYALGDLVDHIVGLTEAFTLAAAKATSGDADDGKTALALATEQGHQAIAELLQPQGYPQPAGGGGTRLARRRGTQCPS